jgi:GNAT superfamily N-acetyltransferase
MADAPIALGFRTDLALLRLQGAEVTDRNGYRVVRTEANPTFRWANFVLCDRPLEPGSVPGWLAVFRAEFPEADHLAFGVDEPGGPGGEPDELAEARLHLERGAVLTAQSLRPPPRPNTQAECRLLRSDADWRAALELTVANNLQRENQKEYRVFAERKRAGLRAAQEAGHGGWFGAFVLDDMVASLGVFTDGSGLARYQSVDTHPDHRGHGLAGTLVQHAGEWILRRADVHTLVIVTDPHYSAVRVYRSLGFLDTEEQLQLEHRPADQPE